MCDLSESHDATVKWTRQVKLQVRQKLHGWWEK